MPHSTDSNASGSTAARAVTALVASWSVITAVYALWLLATGAWPTGPLDGPMRLYMALMGSTGLVAGGLALFVAVRASASRGAQIFGFFLAAVALSWADQGRLYALRALPGVGEPGVAPSGTVWTVLFFFALTGAATGAMLRLSQVFPRPLDAVAIRATPGPRWLRRVQLSMLGPRATWLVGGLAVFVALTAARFLLPRTAITLVAPALGVALLLLATSYLRVGWAHGGDEDRRRIFWFLEAGLIGVATLVVAFWVELAFHAGGIRSAPVRWIHGALPLGLLAMIMVLATGVLYKGALDSRLVVRKTLLYGALGFVLTAVFVGVETLVEELLAARLHLPDRAGGYLAGILAALVFGPLRTGLERRLPVRRAQPVREAPPLPR